MKKKILNSYRVIILAPYFTPPTFTIPKMESLHIPSKSSHESASPKRPQP